MFTKENLLKRIEKSDEQCEHLCLIGLINRDGKIFKLYVDYVFDGSNAEKIQLFNYCPLCGQELKIKPTVNLRPYITFVENK